FVEQHDVEAARPQIGEDRNSPAEIVDARLETRPAGNEIEKDPLFAPARALGEKGLALRQRRPGAGIDIGDAYLVSRRRQRHRQAGIGGANTAVLEQAVKFRGDKTNAQGQEELVRLGRRPAPKRNFALAPVGKRRSLRCSRGICENMAALGMDDLAWLCAAPSTRHGKVRMSLKKDGAPGDAKFSPSGAITCRTPGYTPIAAT